LLPVMSLRLQGRRKEPNRKKAENGKARSWDVAKKHPPLVKTSDPIVKKKRTKKKNAKKKRRRFRHRRHNTVRRTVTNAATAGPTKNKKPVEVYPDV